MMMMMMMIRAISIIESIAFVGSAGVASKRRVPIEVNNM